MYPSSSPSKKLFAALSHYRKLVLTLVVCGALLVTIGWPARAALHPVQQAALRAYGYAFAAFVAPITTLGNYANTAVKTGANTTITPSAAPTETTSLTAIASSGFQGVLTVDPTTGVVRVTNAGPTGVYTVTVKAFGSLGAATKTFTLTVTNPTSCSGSSFIGSTNVGIGTDPISVAVGDFNSDGKLDFATANYDNDTVSIRLGDGAGNFSGSTNISVGSSPISIAVGDFNGDGKLDFATANNGDNTVSIRLGNGAGNFTGSTEVGVGSGPNSIAVGDFNGDGKLDFAAVNNNGDNTVSIRLGDGAGNFSGSIEVGVGSGPNSIAVGDFDGDGKLDFAAVSSGFDTVSIRLGDGAGDFSGSTEVGVGSNPISIAVGDFNGDGKLDFATTNNNDNTVSIRLGDGAGDFSGSTEVDVGNNTRAVAVGDFNGDGKLDFAAANADDDTVSIRLGDGAGGFTGSTNVGVGAFPFSIAVGDFNGDGKLDFATANYDNSTVSIRLNNCTTIVANATPTIIAAAALTQQQGSLAGAAVQIATVNDTETAAGSLTVAATTVPSGITVSNITNTSGAITAIIAAGCSATIGNNTVVLTVTDGGGAMATANLTVNVTANTAPTVGTYANTTLNPNGGTTVTPNAAPADNGSIATVTATASPNTFTGTLSGNTTTGAVTITNAGPSGSYTITVTVSDNCGTMTQKTFTLMVNAGLTITAGATVARQQGATGSTATIATVSDSQIAAGAINVTATTVPAGLTVTTITNTNGTITATIAADCSATIGNNSVVLQASNGTSLATANLIVNVTANLTPTLSIDDVTVAEGNSGLTNAIFTVTLTGAQNSCSPVTVNYAAIAAPGGDYNATSGTLIFPIPVSSNSVTQTINVPINGDLTVENDEPFTVMLSSASGATITKANGLGTITNDDAANITITNASVKEGNSGTTSAAFQIRLNNPVDQPVSLNVATANGTAIAASGDYVADAGSTITFPANSVGPIAYNVSINGDTTMEADETFTVNLTTITTGFPYSFISIADRQAAGLIRDDDPNAGSVLVFPYYTSTADATNNTTLSFNNISSTAALLQLYFVNNNCTQSNIYIPLAPNGCASISAAAFDPGQTGYVLAIAVGSDGKPIQNNSFSGQATLNDGDYVGSYDAARFRANSATPATINTDGTATLHFDGTRYDQVPNQFNVSVQSPVDVVGQRIMTAGILGSLTTAGGLSGAKQIGTGIVISSTGKFASYAVFLSGTCQSISTVSSTRPQVISGMAAVVPSGQTGILDFRIDGGVGLMLTPQTAPGGAKIQPLQPTSFASKTLTIPVFTPPAVTLPTLSINNVTVVEGNVGATSAVFTVTLQDAQFSCAPVTVNYASVSSPDNDYTATSGTLTFTPSVSGGTMTKTITVPVNGDLIVEGNESFSLVLSGASGAMITKAEGIGTITNDDTATIAINDVTVMEGNNGTVNAVFNVTLSALVDQPVVVNFATANGTATTANSDYVAKSGTVTFPANSTASQTIAIAVNGDTVTEPNETFQVNLTPNALPYAGVTIADNQGVGTINNDDANTGSDKKVVPLASDLTVTFTDVTGSGETMAIPRTASTVGTLPTGYTLDGLNLAYDITTTAPYSGPIVVTFKAPDTVTAEQFARLRVLHGENGQLVDRTILAPGSPAPNFATRELSARVTSLSPFVVALAPLPVNQPPIVAGSVLVFPLYTSDVSRPAAVNTRLNFTNTDSTRLAYVHVFFVSNQDCTVADTILCLTPNQTASFLASEFDPGTTGYVVAVAVDARGCPLNFNHLIGSEFVKLASGHAANFQAQAIAALPTGVFACNPADSSATLKFDGVQYSLLPQTLALNNLPSPLEGNDTLLILNRIGGDFNDGAAARLSTLAGLVYNDREIGYSFVQSAGQCQLINRLNNGFPRTSPPLGQIIPPGRTGWLRFNQSDNGAMIGAMINLNPKGFNQGHYLHVLRFTSATLTIPVYTPACVQ